MNHVNKNQASGRAAPMHEASASEHAKQLSEQWRAKHAKRVAGLEAELLQDRPGATRDERLLVHVAAHDAALCDRLAEAELQISERLIALVDNAAVSLALAKGLQRTIACREASARRLRDLLQAAAVLRGQHKLATVTPIKRVA
jgi:hypothetical protein